MLAVAEQGVIVGREGDGGADIHGPCFKGVPFGSTVNNVSRIRLLTAMRLFSSMNTEKRGLVGGCCMAADLYRLCLASIDRCVCSM
jgi:hypothetical protein